MGGGSLLCSLRPAGPYGSPSTSTSAQRCRAGTQTGKAGGTAGVGASDSGRPREFKTL